MIINCWGSRGCVPVSGASYLKYGGDTTCLEIETTSGDTIIIDAGTGIRRLGNRLMRENVRVLHMLFTHTHWDHVSGFPFFEPLYSPDTELIIHPFLRGRKYIELVFSTIMSAPFFPVHYSNLHAKVVYQESSSSTQKIGSVTITAIPTSHPNGGCGYKFTENEKTFVFLTDNELGYVHPGGLEMDEYTSFANGADLLIHDAEFLSSEYSNHRGWGHSTCEHVLDLAVASRVNKLGLFHHNRNRTDQAVDNIVKKARQYLHERGADIECIGVAGGMTFEL